MTTLDAILKDLANYKFDQGVGAPLALRAYVFSHKDDPRPAAKRRPRSSSSSRPRPRRAD